MTDAQPIVVLSYGNAGAMRLQQWLATDPSLACTAGTGLLAACEQAARTWRQTDGRPDGVLSSLGAASVRAMASALISSVLSRTGQRRWCEMAVEPAAAQTFLGLFPGTRFVCLHRRCPDVIYATLANSPWGVSGQQFAPFTIAYPASTVAGLAAWWAGHTDPLLAFEQDHPDACLRLRYEDLLSDEVTRQDLWKFLGLGPDAPSLPSAARPLPGDIRPLLKSAAAPFRAAPDQPGCGNDLPAEQIPPGLLAHVNELQAALGYPPMTPSAWERS
jgi:hypothetical protein